MEQNVKSLGGFTPHYSTPEETPELERVIIQQLESAYKTGLGRASAGDFRWEVDHQWLPAIRQAFEVKV